MTRVLQFRRLFTLLKPRFLFEVLHGSQTRFVTFDEWYREHKENVYINYRIGRIRNSDQLIRIHPFQRKGNTYER